MLSREIGAGEMQAAQLVEILTADFHFNGGASLSAARKDRKKAGDLELCLARTGNQKTNGPKDAQRKTEGAESVNPEILQLNGHVND